MIFTPEQLGQAAYEAYRRSVQRSLSRKGITIKTWYEISPASKQGWIAAVQEVEAILNPAPLPHCPDHEVLTPGCPPCIEALHNRPR